MKPPSREVARGGDEDRRNLWGAMPGEALPHSGLQALYHVEAGILAQHGVSQNRNEIGGRPAGGENRPGRFFSVSALMRLLPFRLAPLVCLLAVDAPKALAAEPAPLTVTAPKPRQVIQRAGFDPGAAAKEKPGHPAFGYADVVVRCEPVEAPEGAVWEYRVTRLTDGAGRDVDWTTLAVRTAKAGTETTARVPAGDESYHQGVAKAVIRSKWRENRRPGWRGLRSAPAQPCRALNRRCTLLIT